MYHSKNHSKGGAFPVPVRTSFLSSERSRELKSSAFPFRDIFSKRFRDTPKENQRKQNVNKPANQRYKEPKIPLAETAPENDASICDENTDEQIKPTSTSFSPSLNYDKPVCCPHCNQRIDSVIEKLKQELQLSQTSIIDSLANKLPETQLSDKIKNHYFPPKKNFMGESLNCSRNLEPGMTADVSVVSPVSTRHVPPSFRASQTITKTDEISNLLYELAEHKAKLASALHTNDEITHELQKKQSEMRQMQMVMQEKEKEVVKFEKENFMLKQEYYKSKEVINQLNTSQKVLMKEFNKFTKLQITLKS